MGASAPGPDRQVLHATSARGSTSSRVLLRVRNALHAVTGKAHDVFSPELREPSALAGPRHIRVGGDLVAAMQSIDRLAERKWPEIVEDGSVPAVGSGRLSGPEESVKPDSPPTMDDLDRLLETGERGRTIFDSLWEGGHLSDVLPEWGVVASLPQLEPFHQRPVAAHLWRTVAEMQAVLVDRVRSAMSGSSWTSHGCSGSPPSSTTSAKATAGSTPKSVPRSQPLRRADRI